MSCDAAALSSIQLALKLHPDKNSAPGAEDAFKAVGKAFAILSDPDKRAHYDRYGDSTPQSGSQAQQRRYQNDEVSPEDIFNMFFGGGFAHPHRGRRAQPAARHSHQAPQGQQQQQARGPLGQLAQFLPLLMILLLSLMSIPSAPDVPFRCVSHISAACRGAFGYDN